MRIGVPLCGFVVVTLALSLRTAGSPFQERLRLPPSSIPPAKGSLLVASSRIDSLPFRESVVLLVAHGDQGTVGLIINRASDVALSEVLPDVDKEKRDPILSFGGPVALDGLLYLIRADEPPQNSSHVMEDVYFSGDRRLLEELLEEDPEPMFRIFLGYAGWAPGQLENEIGRGDWKLHQGDAKTVFRPNLETLWNELTQERTVAAS